MPCYGGSGGGSTSPDELDLRSGSGDPSGWGDAGWHIAQPDATDVPWTDDYTLFQKWLMGLGLFIVGKGEAILRFGYSVDEWERTYSNVTGTTSLGSLGIHTGTLAASFYITQPALWIGGCAHILLTGYNNESLLRGESTVVARIFTGSGKMVDWTRCNIYTLA